MKSQSGTKIQLQNYIFVFYFIQDKENWDKYYYAIFYYTDIVDKLQGYVFLIFNHFAVTIIVVNSIKKIK